MTIYELRYFSNIHKKEYSLHPLFVNRAQAEQSAEELRQKPSVSYVYISMRLLVGEINYV